jgi:hypothetical protein
MGDKSPHMENTTLGMEQSHKGLSGGLALIIIGLFLLGHSLHWPVPENWWAVFILIPIAPKMIRAGAFLIRGNFLAAFRAIGSSLFLFLVAMIFLLNLDWESLVPAFFILGGIVMLLPKGKRKYW